MAQGQRGRMRRYYAAFFVPSHVGEWHVFFPDLPDCEAYGFTLRDAEYAAATALAHYGEQKGALLAPPRSVAQISKDEVWLSQNGVQLAKAIITMIPLSTENFPGRPTTEDGYLVRSVEAQDPRRDPMAEN